MSADGRLAEAIGVVVRGKLSAGMGYLRIPEIVSPFPLAVLMYPRHFASLREGRRLVDIVDIVDLSTPVHTPYATCPARQQQPNQPSQSGAGGR